MGDADRGTWAERLPPYMNFSLPQSRFFGSHAHEQRSLPIHGRALSISRKMECRLGRKLAPRVWRFSQVHCQRWSDIKNSRADHSDFNGLNFLVALSPSGVLAVLEWEDAFSWNAYADIGNMLRYEPQSLSRPRRRARERLAHGGKTGRFGGPFRHAPTLPPIRLGGRRT